MKFTQTWRWFGPNDPVTLQEIRQTGATGIVTALHHIPNGEVWRVEDIRQRQQIIADAGLKWEVVESLPVHEDIKKGRGKAYIQNYKTSIQNLGECGLKILCYNFMPVLDWSRTDLDFQHADGTSGLRFDSIALAAFDIFILKREGAENSYPGSIITQAKDYFGEMTATDIQQLTTNILAGLPGAEEHFSLDSFKAVLQEYRNIGPAELKSHLFGFLREVIPAAEAAGVRMCIHPDDPPFSLFGLPRVVSNAQDIREIYAAADSVNNGLTFCSGSFGAGKENDLVAIAREFAERIHFLHLRNVTKESNGSFYEAGHLTGDADMYLILKELVKEQEKRQAAGRTDIDIPFRPDHGLLMLSDTGKKHNPGYSLIGRLCGLAEIRALEAGVRRSLSEK